MRCCLPPWAFCTKYGFRCESNICNSGGAWQMAEYRGTEGTRPYVGAGWYYAEYRQRVSTEFIMLLATHLGWTRSERVLDLGAGPGQLALLVAPVVADVVAIEPEPDMLAEGQRRARTVGANNVTFIAATSDDLGALRAALGRFRTALM